MVQPTDPPPIADHKYGSSQRLRSKAYPSSLRPDAREDLGGAAPYVPRWAASGGICPWRRHRPSLEVNSALERAFAASTKADLVHMATEIGIPMTELVEQQGSLITEQWLADAGLTGRVSDTRHRPRVPPLRPHHRSRRRYLPSQRR